MSKQPKIIYLMGLPASGKTHYANNQKATTTQWPYKAQPFVEIIHLDEIPKEEWEDKLPLYREREANIVIVDGLLLTEKDILEVSDVLANLGYYPESVEILFWDPDVEACLWNDIGRRDQSSTASIQSLQLVLPNTVRLEKELKVPVAITHMQVIRKSQSMAISDKYHLEANNGILQSSYWLISGDDGSETTTVRPDGIATLDKWLEEVCPWLSFVAYKQLIRQCVKTCRKPFDDYYYEGVYGFYECNIAEVVEFLQTNTTYGKNLI